MTLSALLLLQVFSVQTGPPPGQEFHFSAEYAHSGDSVGLSLIRTAKTSPRRLGEEERTLPLYGWRVPEGGVSFSLMPLNGQRPPRIWGLDHQDELEPRFRAGHNGGAVEEVSAGGRVDWAGCTPGFYRLVAEVVVEGSDRRWIMRSDHHVYYIRKVLKVAPTMRIGQDFLMVDREAERGSNAIIRGMPDLYGAVLSVVAVDKRDAFGHTPFTLHSTKNDREYRIAKFSDSVDSAMVPVMADEDVTALRAKYVGKTMYPMSRLLSVTMGPSHHQLRHLKRGGGPVVIRGIWRSAKLLHLGQIDPFLLGDSYQVSGWYPLMVVFELKGQTIFEDAQLDSEKLFVTPLADPWAFERTFSLTSKSQDFVDWKPIPGGFAEPPWPESGFTPKQVAWLRGWPNVVRSYEDTIKLPTWIYTRKGKTHRIMRFVNGRLVL